MPDQIPLLDPQGNVVGVDPESYDRFVGQGYRPLSTQEQSDVGNEQAREQLYNSPEHTVQAFGQGVNRGLTFGLSDLLVDKENANALRKYHGVAAGVGEITGALAGGVAGAAERGALSLGGKALAATPSALSARAASAVARRVAGAEATRGVAQKIVGGAVEAAIDGGLFNAGQAVSNAALGNDPLTVDRLAANIATGALFGGAIGGGLGAVGAASGAIRKKLAAKSNPLLNPRSAGSKELGAHIGKVAREVDKGVDDALALAVQRRADEVELAVGGWQVDPVKYGHLAPDQRDIGRVFEDMSSTPKPPSAADDIATGAGKKGAKPKRKGGLHQFADEANAQKNAEAGLPADAPPTHAPLPPGTNPAQHAQQVARQEMGELRREIATARRGLVERFGPDLDVDMAALARKSPGQAFKAIEAWDVYSKALRKLDDAAGSQLSSHLSDPKVLIEGLAGKASPELARSLEHIGKLDRRGVADALKLDVSKLPAASSPAADLLLKAYAVGRFAEGFTAKAAVQAAESRLGRAGLVAAGAGLLGGVNPAVGAAVGLVLGHPSRNLMRLATSAGRMASKVYDGVDAFVQRATGKTARRAASVTAQSILAEVRFSSDKEDKEAPVPVRRMRELQHLMGNPGQLEQYVDEQLTPLRAHNLDLGFAVADSVKARIKFYGSKMPFLPPPDPFTGFQEEPSQGELDDWAKYVAAGENPERLLQELRDGDLTPETVEAVQAIYPALYGEMQEKLAEAIPTLRSKLEYGDKLNLSLLFDVPVEQTATDEMFFSMQEMYALQAEEDQQRAASSKPGGAAKPYAPTKGQLLTDR